MGNGNDGFKVTLGINTTLIVAAIVAVVGIYMQVQALAQDNEHADALHIPRRVVVLENEQTHMKDAIDDIKRDIEKIDDKQDKILEAVTNP